MVSAKVLNDIIGADPLATPLSTSGWGRDEVTVSYRQDIVEMSYYGICVVKYNIK